MLTTFSELCWLLQPPPKEQHFRGSKGVQGTQCDTQGTSLAICKLTQLPQTQLVALCHLGLPPTLNHSTGGMK